MGQLRKKGTRNTQFAAYFHFPGNTEGISLHACRHSCSQSRILGLGPSRVGSGWDITAFSWVGSRFFPGLAEIRLMRFLVQTGGVISYIFIDVDYSFSEGCMNC